MDGPGDASAKQMWSLMEALYPIPRALCGPGYLASLECISERLPLDIKGYPSGEKVFDWVIPREFKVNEGWVKDPDGRKVIDFEDCHYHVWNYSQSFHGSMDLEELRKNVATLPHLPHAVPFRPTYYREKWGLAASEDLMKSLKPGTYEVHIDTELKNGLLRIGECFLPGESDREILIGSYLCHPLGANDNLSGVVVAVELFRLLAAMPKRRFSYRLALWPETIGAIAYIHRNPDRLKRTAGGYLVQCCGDEGPLHYKTSFGGNDLIDRAYLHAVKHSGLAHKIMPYNHHHTGSDSCQFNAIGVRIPFGSVMRSPPNRYPQYHSSADDMVYVRPQALLESLQVLWTAVQAIEKAETYRGNFTVDPFLSGHGIYPYDQGAGEGKLGGPIAIAYYELMGGIDGGTDLLTIAERAGIPLEAFDRPVRDFLRKGLMDRVPPQAAGGNP